MLHAAQLAGRTGARRRRRARRRISWSPQEKAAPVARPVRRRHQRAAQVGEPVVAPPTPPGPAVDPPVAVGGVAQRGQPVARVAGAERRPDRPRSRRSRRRASASRCQSCQSQRSSRTGSSVGSRDSVGGIPPAATVTDRQACRRAQSSSRRTRGSASRTSAGQHTSPASTSRSHSSGASRVNRQIRSTAVVVASGPARSWPARSRTSARRPYARAATPCATSRRSLSAEPDHRHQRYAPAGQLGLRGRPAGR